MVSSMRKSEWSAYLPNEKTFQEPSPSLMLGEEIIHTICHLRKAEGISLKEIIKNINMPKSDDFDTSDIKAYLEDAVALGILSIEDEKYRINFRGSHLCYCGKMTILRDQSFRQCHRSSSNSDSAFSEDSCRTNLMSNRQSSCSGSPMTSCQPSCSKSLLTGSKLPCSSKKSRRHSNSSSQRLIRKNPNNHQGRKSRGHSKVRNRISRRRKLPADHKSPSNSNSIAHHRRTHSASRRRSLDNRVSPHPSRFQSRRGTLTKSHGRYCSRSSSTGHRSVSSSQNVNIKRFRSESPVSSCKRWHKLFRKSKKKHSKRRKNQLASNLQQTKNASLGALPLKDNQTENF